MLPRMRLIKDAYSELKAMDPETAVTPYYIRQLALSGEIPVHMAGRKRLINFDALLSYLGSPENRECSAPVSGTIRRIG